MRRTRWRLMRGTRWRLMRGARRRRGLRARIAALPSVGAKLVLLLTGAGLSGALGITLLLASVITPSFNRLEARAIAGQVDRTDAALAAFGSRVERVARRVANGVPMASAALARPDGARALADAAVDRSGAVVHWRDEGEGKGESPSSLHAALARHVASTDIAAVLHGRASAHYFTRLDGTVTAIGVAPSARSAVPGGRRGWTLVARALTSRQLAGMVPVDARLAPAVPGGTVVTSRRTSVAVAVPLLGPDGRAVAVVRFTLPRDVSLLGRRMLLLAIAGSTLLLLIVLSVLRQVIDRLVLAPLARVEGHMQRVRASGLLTPLAEDRRRDEIGSLGRSFNAMLRQLADLHEQIEAQSFALGRSESAVAVMHNVRNALSPVSTILSQGAGQGGPIERATVDRALAELAGGDLPAARRERLVAFVAAALHAEAGWREATRRELGIGQQAMAHVLEIIGQQQRSSHERPALEPVDVSETVARNAAIARYSDAASIAFSFPADRHWALASRVILSQVVGNLLGNAAEAIAATGRGSGSIAVSVAEAAGLVEIRIRDDGEGFAPDMGATLFQRGFSTRAHKSGGLGLHWCANSMIAMGGTLRLESEGQGRGAVAVLTLEAVVRETVARAA